MHRFSKQFKVSIIRRLVTLSDTLYSFIICRYRVFANWSI